MEIIDGKYNRNSNLYYNLKLLFVRFELKTSGSGGSLRANDGRLVGSTENCLTTVGSFHPGGGGKTLNGFLGEVGEMSPRTDPDKRATSRTRRVSDRNRQFDRVRHARVSIRPRTRRSRYFFYTIAAARNLTLLRSSFSRRAVRTQTLKDKCSPTRCVHR